MKKLAKRVALLALAGVAALLTAIARRTHRATVTDGHSSTSTTMSKLK